MVEEEAVIFVLHEGVEEEAATFVLDELGLEVHEDEEAVVFVLDEDEEVVTFVFDEVG